QNSLDAVNSVERSASSEEQGDPYQALDDKQALGQHQRRPESAARRQLPEIDDEPPDGDDHRDEESRAEQAGVKEQKRAQEASSNSSTREMAPSSASLN